LRGFEQPGGQLGIPVGHLVLAKEEVHLAGTHITYPSDERQGRVAFWQLGGTRLAVD
jgi:hypothetical protein